MMLALTEFGDPFEYWRVEKSGVGGVPEVGTAGTIRYRLVLQAHEISNIGQFQDAFPGCPPRRNLHMNMNDNVFHIFEIFQINIFSYFLHTD